MRLQFGDCTLDPDRPELYREGQPVALSPRGMRLLLMLVERRPEPVGQRELRDALWPQTHVGYTSLAQVVTEVRKAIGDQPGAEGLIRTVPRTGYAFAAAVRVATDGGGPDASASAAPQPDEGREALPRAAADPSAHPTAEDPGERATVHAKARRRWPGVVALVGAVLLGGVAGAWLSRLGSEAAPPRFTQLTFRRGIVTSARFSHDGNTVVYSALWDGGPPEVFTRRLDGSASVSLGIPRASLLGVSSRGEAAVLLAPPGERGVLWLGTLARVPLSGGPVRPVLERVLDADWSPDGRELAVVRWHAGQYQLEYPIGHVVVRPCAPARLRVSPRGDRLALLDAEGVLLVDTAGGATRLPVPAAHQRLAWWGEDALLVDAGDSDLRRTLRRVRLDGRVDEIAALAGTLVVHDVSRDGRVLLHHGFERWSVRARAPGEAAEHDASVYANSQVQGLSADGERILLWDGGEGPPGTALLYPTRGGAAVRLGEGRPLGLSADGEWFLLDRSTGGRPRLALAPTGAGAVRALPLDALRVAGPYHLEADGVGLVGSEPGRPRRSFYLEGANATPRAVTPEGVVAIPGLLPGRELLARGEDGSLSVHRLADGASRKLAWTLPAEDPFLETVAAIDGGRSLVVREGSMPARLSRIDLASGARAPWRTLGPADATGVGHVWTTLVTPDGEGYAYTHGFFLQDLFLVEGLR